MGDLSLAIALTAIIYLVIISFAFVNRQSWTMSRKKVYFIIFLLSMTLIALYAYSTCDVAILPVAVTSSGGTRSKSQTQSLVADVAKMFRVKPPPKRRVSKLTDDVTLVAWWLEETEKPLGDVSSMSKAKIIDAARRYFFGPHLTSNERLMLLKTAKTCLALAEQAGMVPILMATNLIGYYRHNKSLSPFDDDFDLAILVNTKTEVNETRNRFLELLRNHPTHRAMYKEKFHRLKCFGKTNDTCTRYFEKHGWCWPYIDMQFFIKKTSRRRGQERHYYVDMATPETIVPTEKMNPPRRVVYSELEIPTYIPNDIHGLLPKDLSLCRGKPQWDHQNEKFASHVVWVKCSDISHFANFTYIEDN